MRLLKQLRNHHDLLQVSRKSSLRVFDGASRHEATLNFHCSNFETTTSEIHEIPPQTLSRALTLPNILIRLMHDTLLTKTTDSLVTKLSF